MWNVKGIRLIIIQFLKVTRQSLTIVIYLIVFFLGFTAGFLVFQTLYKQADVTGWIFAIITWGLSAGGMFGLFNAILKDKRERELIPKLEFETIRIQQNESIFFYSTSSSSENPLIETEPKPYNEFMNKSLIVEIGSSNAPTFEYKSTIRDIISNAV
jgi:hypothetical protein